MFESPLIQSLKRLDIKKDREAVYFYSVILLISVFISCIVFLPSAQKIAMRKFHLNVRPFGQWAALQFVPAMYNFHNDISISFYPLQYSEMIPSPSVRNVVVNHYPLRIIYFTTNRKSVVFKKPLYVYLHSVYRGQELVTVYELSSTSRKIRAQLLNTYERSNR